jgi:hypothetical protein
VCQVNHQQQILSHKRYQWTALVRLANNPWTESASQPTARAAMTAAMRSLHRRVRGAASDERAPPTSVLDLLPASGLRASHVAALHLSPDESILHADDAFAPLRVAAPMHAPSAFTAAQLATMIYQTVGVLPSSIPTSPCFIVPAALVGRAGPYTSAAERDADSQLLFDRLFFDRPIGVTARADAPTMSLVSNPLFQSVAASPPPQQLRRLAPPLSRSVSLAMGVSTTMPMMRRQVSTDLNAGLNENVSLESTTEVNSRPQPPERTNAMAGGVRPPPPPPRAPPRSKANADS